MAQAYVLKIYPAGRSREIYRVMEITGDATLDDLCGAILDAFDFSDEHLYEFCMDNRMYSEDCYQSEPDYDERSTEALMDELDLIKGQNFSLHYDFGDDWMFTIHVQKILEESTHDGVTLLREKGELKQYPNWDDKEE